MTHEQMKAVMKELFDAETAQMIYEHINNDVETQVRFDAAVVQFHNRMKAVDSDGKISRRDQGIMLRKWLTIFGGAYEHFKDDFTSQQQFHA